MLLVLGLPLIFLEASLGAFVGGRGAAVKMWRAVPILKGKF